MKKLVLRLFIIIMLLSIGAVAYCSSTEVEIQHKIVIDILRRRLTLYEGEDVVKEYPVAVGKSSSQTPIGEYKILNKVVNPYYFKKNIPGGSPNNPLGTRWLGFWPHYGIHGNSDPNSIGTFASGGCVRMFERDVQELYSIVKVGTPVTVKYDIAQIETDIDGLNPILVTYPDYYSKEANDIDVIIEKLTSMRMIDLIAPDRLDSLRNLAINQKTLFTDKWAFFVNDRYITNDIVQENDDYYINRDKLEKYFNIEINKVYGKDEFQFIDSLIGGKLYNSIYYISIKDISLIIGADLEINNDTKVAYLKLIDYLVINNKLVAGKLVDTLTEPKMSLESLIEPLDIKVSFSDSIHFLLDNKEIEYSFYENEPYVSLTRLAEDFNINLDIFTTDNHIELFTEPLIVYNRNIYKGKYINHDIYIPMHIVNNEREAEVSEDLPAFITTSKARTKSIDSIEYIRLKDIEQHLLIEQNIYGTKIYISNRSI